MSQGSTISMSFKIEETAGGFKKLVTDADSFRNIIKSTVVEAEKLRNSAINFAAIATGIDSANRTISDLQSTLKGMTDAHAAQIEAETQLAVNMRNTMGAREEDIQSIKDLCAEQQKLGVIGDEVQLSGAQELATYLSEKQSLEKLIPVMNDMLAQQYGLNATQENAAQIATMLGKVMDGQTGALSRYGYTFDAAQEQILKFGTESQRAAVLCDVVSSSVGGMNEEFGKTDDGKQKQLDNTIGDLKETLGGLVQGAMPFVTIAANAMLALTGVVKLTSAVKAATVALKGWNIAQKLLTAGVFMSTGSIKKATQTVNAYSTAAKGSAAATRAVTLALRGLLISTIIGAAITVLIAIICKFTDAADDAADSTNKLASAEERAKKEAEELAQLREQETATVNNARAALEINITKLKDFNGTKEQEKKLVNEMNNTYGETMKYFSSVSSWYEALVANSKAYCQQMIIEARIRAYANRIAQLEMEEADLLAPFNGEYPPETKPNKKPRSNKPNPSKPLAGLQNLSGSGNNLLNFNQPDPLAPLDIVAGANKFMVSEARKKRSEIVRLQAQMEKDVQSLSTIKLPKTGSSTRPSSGTGGGHSGQSSTVTEQEKTRQQELNDLINKALEEYVTASETRRKELRNDIAVWRTELDGIELLKKQAERPAKLNSIRDIDNEIAYQQALWARASDEERGNIEKEIEFLKDLRRQKERVAHVEIPVEEIKSYQQLNDELSYYTDLLREATTEEDRAKYQTHINSLKSLQKKWDNDLAELQKPAEIAELNTLGEIDTAISYYQQKQQSATADEIQNIQAIIDALEQKREALLRGGGLAAMQSEVDEINALTGRERKVRIGEIGFDELTAKINELNKLLSDTENPLTDKQRKEVQSLIAVYEQWRKQCVLSYDTFSEGWGTLKGISSGVEGITSALEGNVSAWEAVTKAIDGFLQIVEGIKKAIAIINLLRKVTRLSADATEANTEATAADTAAVVANAAATGDIAAATGIDTANTVANTVATGANTVATVGNATAATANAAATGADAAASVSNTAAKSGEAIAEAVESGAGLPFPANIAAIAGGVAAALAALASIGQFATGGIVGGNSPSGDRVLARVNSGEMILNKAQQSKLFKMINTGIMPFANGGIISGPTVAMIGEYPGVASNPEVVAPLNKLRRLLNPAGQPVVVGGTLRVAGRDLVCVLANETRIASKTGRRTNIKL